MMSITDRQNRIINTLDDIIRYALDENYHQAIDYVSILKIQLNRLEADLIRQNELEEGERS